MSFCLFVLSYNLKDSIWPGQACWKAKPWTYLTAITAIPDFLLPPGWRFTQGPDTLPNSSWPGPAQVRDREVCTVTLHPSFRSFTCFALPVVCILSILFFTGHMWVSKTFRFYHTVHIPFLSLIAELAVLVGSIHCFTLSTFCQYLFILICFLKDVEGNIWS